jgi:hypothetical protein
MMTLYVVGDWGVCCSVEYGTSETVPYLSRELAGSTRETRDTVHSTLDPIGDWRVIGGSFCFICDH